jgi:hypothetical protein
VSGASEYGRAQLPGAIHTRTEPVVLRDVVGDMTVGSTTSSHGVVSAPALPVPTCSRGLLNLLIAVEMYMLSATVFEPSARWGAS